MLTVIVYSRTDAVWRHIANNGVERAFDSLTQAIDYLEGTHEKGTHASEPSRRTDGT
jgi:hypothetical protein